MTSVAYNDLLGSSKIILFCCLFGYFFFFQIIAHVVAGEAGFVLIGIIFNSASIPFNFSHVICCPCLCLILPYD